MDVVKLGLWPMRITWFVVLLAVGLGFRDIFDDSQGSVATVAEIMLWGAWFVGLVCLLAPSTMSLTAFRIISPAAPVVSLLGAIATGTWTVSTAAAIAVGLITFILSLSPIVGDVMVNSSAYGPERRLALRPPAALLVGPIQLAWTVCFAGMVSGPLLIANGNYLLGPLALVLGAGLVWQTSRSLHQLSRRWVVFVPAGFVIHDYWVLAESIMFRRPQIRALGPMALDVGNYLDLGANAQGLSLMVQLDAKVPLALRAKRDIQTMSAHRLVFVPTLPGSLIHEARVRGIKIESEAQRIDPD